MTANDFIEAMEAAGREQFEWISNAYDTSMRLTGEAIQFRLFDPQLADALTEEWLLANAPDEELTEADLRSMIEQGYLRTWKTRQGNEGYILYAEHQAKVLKKLIRSGRYDGAELRHIAETWNEYIEYCICEEPPYDQDDVPEIEHYRRRVKENVLEFEADAERFSSKPEWMTSEEMYLAQRTIIEEKLLYWRKIDRYLDRVPEDQFSENFSKGYKKDLFKLRWLDENVRMMMAEKFSSKLEQGYSPEVHFRRESMDAEGYQFFEIDWNWTLRHFRETLSEGRVFPLRTPLFNVTHRGIEFLKCLSPKDYEAAYDQFNLAELETALAQLGADYWTVESRPEAGDAICSGCGALFQRTHPRKRFCSDSCQKRAKARRWREKNPESAREAQARYWKSAYGEETIN